MADLRKGYWVELLPGERADGQLVITLIAKRSFTIPIDQPVIEPIEDDDQPPLLTEDRYDEGDAETAPPTLEHELVGEKGGADVIVVGKAYAPGGKPKKEYECAIRIGDKLRRLRIVGPRKCRWLRPKKRKDAPPVPSPPVFGEAKPIAVVDLTYANAYGGQTWVIPDEETLRISRTVAEVMEDEGREKAEKKAKAKEEKIKAAEKKKKEEEEQAMLDEAVGAISEEDEKLLRARGQFGYDHEGVRLAGVATSQRGTAVMDMDSFEQWQAEQDKMEAEGRLSEEEKAAVDAMRRNALGEGLVIDDGVEILDADKLAEELAKSEEEQEARRQELADAAKSRKREAVEMAGGTRMIDLDAVDDGDKDAWEGDLGEQLKEEDVEREEARLAEIKERKKKEEEALAEFGKFPCPTNPYGKGFYVSPVRQIVDRLELPLIEDPDAPLTPRDLMQNIEKLEDVPLPAGFSVFPRHASPRVDYAGEYPSELAGWEAEQERQKREMDLEEEDDVIALREMDKRRMPGQMDRRWFNSASPCLRLDFLAGDEEITLTNLTKDGTMYFRLPSRSLQAELDRGRGVERQEMVLDTLIIEPEERQVSMLWRAWFEMESWDELGEYPQMIGWVLDLDIKDKRRKDWEDATAKARGDGTQMLDISEADLDPEDPYWRTISDKRKAEEAAAAAVEGTAALDIERMGLYRQVDDEDWVAEASDGTVDVAAEKKKAAEEEAYLEKKQDAMKKLEASEKEEDERRQEIAEAAAEGKPIPPKDADKTPKQLKEKAKKKAEASKKATEAAKKAKKGKGGKKAAEAAKQAKGGKKAGEAAKKASKAKKPRPKKKK